MSIDELAANASLIDRMGALLRDEAHAFSAGPELLRRILEDGAWREFKTKRGEVVRPATFAEFVTAKPLRGLGATLRLVQRVAAEDPVTLDLLDQAIQRPPSLHAVDNIHGAERPSGTSESAALRRLRKDRPDLHAEVMTGALSAHAAMIKAGFRPKTATIRLDNPRSVAKTLRKRLSTDQLAELKQLLFAES